MVPLPGLELRYDIALFQRSFPQFLPPFAPKDPSPEVDSQSMLSLPLALHGSRLDDPPPVVHRVLLAAGLGEDRLHRLVP